MLTLTHYDDYAGLPAGLSVYLTSWNSYFGNTDNYNWPYPQMPQYSNDVKGMATWTQTKVLGTSNTFLNTVSYYDDKGRVIQVQSTNLSGGTDVVTTQYSWAGQPLITVQKLEKSGNNAQTTVVVTQNSYDDLGRLVKVEKKASNSLINGGTMAASYNTILQNEYDKLGQLKKKTLGSASLEALNYEYNIRGWLLGVNRNYAKDQNSSNYFGFDLGYDKTVNGIIGNQAYSNPQYNGNIEGMVWKSKGDGEKRKCDFVYDAANRLLRSDFTQYTNSSFNTSAGVDFSMKMGDGVNVAGAYDDNGNIKQMQQWGLKLNGSLQIDNMAYAYQAGSNKLARVTDAVTTDNKLGDFKDGTNTGTDDYSYDLNGNLTLDNNKSISSITYNHLNLPQTITITGKGTITYTYDAAGNKLKKVTVDNTVSPVRSTATLYLGGSVYQNDTLQFIVHEEGRMRPGITAFNYDYFLKDHLGNVRMVFTEEQKTDMYPAATMETSTIATESNYYGNLSNTQTAKPSFFSDPLYSTNAMVARVKNAAGVQKIGPNIVLKVMAGDSYNIRVASGWSSASSATNNTTNVLNDLLLAISNSVAGVSHGKANSTELQSGTSGLNTGLSNFMSTQTSTGTKPKAYINWIMLDEQFKYYAGGFEQVGASGVTTIHTRSNLPVTKSGYLFVYTSNEATNIDVYFDNLQVTHTRGPILEETHYYPFGLTMAGISSKAAGSLENKKKFIGQQLDDDLGLNCYQFRFRNHDPQIGRFIGIDPLADKYVYNSTYAYAENKVGMGFDLEGLELVEFNRMFQAAGINVEQANRNTQAAATALAKKAEPVINVTKDIITISGGVSLLVASGGTAAPLLVGLAGSATVAGGTVKLAFDIAGNKDAADQIPTTLSGTAIFLTNGASEATTGKKLISDDVKTVAEFSEGVLTFKVSGFDKMKDVEKVSTILSGLSLTLDGLNPETAKAFQNLLGGATGGNIPSLNIDNKAKVDNTYVRPLVIVPLKKELNQ